MSIFQFFRIIWAYRVMVLVLTGVCLSVGVIVVQLLPPRYEAQSRVMLDIIKPDPVTGQVMATAFARAFTKTQIELVTDPQTARYVVDDLKLAKDPLTLRRYRDSKKRQDVELDRWAAQEIADNASARLIEGSNILEITYASPLPEEAKTVADSLRKAYLASTLQTRREAARRNAEWYEGQATKTKAILFQAEATKSNFERQSGIVLGDDKIDIDSARLAAMANSGGGGSFMTPSAAGTSPSTIQLAQLDSEIAEAARNLGPNHPTLLQAQRRRGLLAQQAAQERNAAGSSAASAQNAARATSGMLEAQKAKVMAQREEVERLRLMQDEIDLRRDQYNKAVARGAQLRQEADVAEAGATPLANAIVPQSPVFPNKPLIIGAAVGGGFALGIFLALLLELSGRRVRSADDLYSAVDAPVLAVIRRASKPKVSLWNRLSNQRTRGRISTRAA